VWFEIKEVSRTASLVWDWSLVIGYWEKKDAADVPFSIIEESSQFPVPNP
jgi:hypothetical protein